MKVPAGRNTKRLAYGAVAVLLAYFLLIHREGTGSEEPSAVLQPAQMAAMLTSAASPLATQRLVAPHAGTLLTTIVTKPHPSCLALQYITARVPSSAPPPRGPPAPKGAPKGPRPTLVPMPAALEYWREYSRPDFNCFKHGGHYDPGLPRRGTADGQGGVASDQLRRLVLHNVYYWNGEWFQLITSYDAKEATIVLPFAAYFPMVSGNWPQPIVDRITVHRVRALPWVSALTRASPQIVHKQFGYLQPPTDYLSVYHVAVETIFPLFHTLHESALPLGNVAVITARPRATAYGFKERGCTLSFERCLDTVWGAMHLALTIADESTAQGLLRGTIKPSSVIAECRRNATARACMYGLHTEEQQLRHDVPTSSAHPFVPHRDEGTATLFDNLFVGNPTHCEPLWGGDPHYAEVVAQKHAIRGATGDVGRGARGLHQLIDPAFLNTTASFPTFVESYASCQGALRAFRSTFVRLASRSPPSVVMTPLSLDALSPVHIVVTSRKGDWARQLLDEDEIIALLTKHLSARYPPGSTVRAIRFGGSLSEQLDDQMDLATTTLFIGNHGANLLNSVFLRPNAGLITLSLRNPGFYPFSVFPEWLHVRDIVAEQMCNRRLFKGKCRWMEGNNNDMFLSDAQRQLLLTHVDAIINAQRTSPRV